MTRARVAHSLGALLFSASALASMALFVDVVARPVSWVHTELVSHRFFWAQERLDSLRLRSGFRADDLLKPFAADRVDGVFRMRQFSYLTEMLAWKAETALFPVSFVVRGHVLLGVANAVLVTIVIWRLTTNALAGAVGGVLVLGSGITLATMTFGFRNAKILVMTLFLVAALIGLGTGAARAPLGRGRLAALVAVTLLAVFTDEAAVFLMPVVWLDVLWRAPVRRDVVVAAGVTAALTGILIVAVMVVTLLATHAPADASAIVRALRATSRLLREEPVFTENLRAWTLHFLPRTVGGRPGWMGGGAALGGLACLVALAVSGPGRRRILWRLMALLSLGGLALAVLLPHNSGVHQSLMPADARVPTLLYFSYYYPYPFTVILSLCLGLLLAGVDVARGAAALALATVANVAAAGAAREGPRDALAYHEWRPEHLAAVRQVFALASFARRLAPGDVAYVSVPTGSASLINCDLPAMHVRKPDIRACLVPLLYLRDLESGRLRTSLHNIPAAPPMPAGMELAGARYFYDLSSGRVVDLEWLRHVGHLEDRAPERIVRETTVDLPLGTERGPVLLFVRGRSILKVGGERERLVATQRYGEAYQLIEVPTDALLGVGRTLRVAVEPADAGSTVHLVSARLGSGEGAAW